MNAKWIKITIIVAAIGLISFAAVAAYARGPQQNGPDWSGYDDSLVATAADALGMTRTDLVAELVSGKTIAQVAEEKGVSLDTIVEAFTQNHAAFLAARVAAGRITQETADSMLALMKTHITDQLNQPFAGQNFAQGRPGGMMGQGVQPGGAFGYGRQNGMMGHGGRGMGYVDADGDGWCDHCPNTQAANGTF
jgi:hypothetical protein